MDVEKATTTSTWPHWRLTSRAASHVTNIRFPSARRGAEQRETGTQRRRATRPARLSLLRPFRTHTHRTCAWDECAAQRSAERQSRRAHLHLHEVEVVRRGAAGARVRLTFSSNGTGNWETEEIHRNAPHGIESAEQKPSQVRVRDSEVTWGP